MSNSNSNDTDYDKKYSGILNYIFSENLTSFSMTFVISAIIFFIFVIIGSTSENNKGILILSGFISFALINGFYFAYIYSDYSNYKTKQNLQDKKANAEAEAEAEADAEAKRQDELEENAICNVNPNLCMHGGSCQSYGSDKQQYRCNCTAGWTGQDCNTPDNITIKDTDIDPRCSNKTTGEKNSDTEWCNADFDGRGGKCVNKDKYQIECPINRDGSPNYKYNEYGCDVENDEVWCPETTTEQVGKCIVRAPGVVGDLCNVSTISQDCLGNPDLIWDNGKQTCVDNCRRGQVYNKNLQKCVTYDCSINTSSITCSGSGVDNYCRWDNTNNKCVIDRSTRQCQSLGKNRCQNSETCTWSNDMCYDNDRSDCSYNNNRNLCQSHPQCSWNNASNVCVECTDGMCLMY